MREDGQNGQFEDDRSQEILSEQEIKLPTSPEIAQKGMVSFKSILDQLPPKLQQTVLKWEWYHTSFLGIEPWMNIAKHHSLTEEEQDQIDDAINSDPNFLIIPHYRQGANGDSFKCRAVFNLLAVKKIIDNYPEYFDSIAINDPRDWLNKWPEPSLKTIKSIADSEEQKAALKKYHYQRGLLSGYPIWAMSKFVKGKFTKDNLQHPSSELTDQYKTTLGYRSCSRFRQLDDEYIKKLEEIKAQSGLKEIIDSYSNV